MEPFTYLKKSVAFHDHVGQPLSGGQILTEVLLIWLPGGIFLLDDSVIEGERLQRIPNPRAFHSTQLIPLSCLHT